MENRTSQIKKKKKRAFMHNFHGKCHYKSWNSLQLPSVIISTCQTRTRLTKKGKTKTLLVSKDTEVVG